MAFVPGNYNNPVLQSISMLQSRRNYRLYPHIKACKDTEKQAASRILVKFTPIHSRKISDSQCLEMKRNHKAIKSANRISQKSSYNKTLEMKTSSNDSVGIGFCTYALESNREFYKTKKRLTTLEKYEYEKKPYRNIGLRHGRVKGKEYSVLTLSPWQELA